MAKKRKKEIVLTYIVLIIIAMLMILFNIGNQTIVLGLLSGLVVAFCSTLLNWWERER